MIANHGGNLYQIARQTGYAIESLYDFSANINPFGLSEAVRQAINDNIEHLINYPDTEVAELRHEIACFYNVDYDEIVVGNGAVELLYLLCHMLRPIKAIIPVPSFSEYERAARAAKIKVDYVYLSEAMDFKINIQDISNKLTQNSIVLLGNPNNPTGALLSVAEIMPLLNTAKTKNTIVVMDESFMDFIVNSEDYTCRNLIKEYPNLIILNSLTKFYAIPGLRLGFAVMNTILAKQVLESKDPWNVNSLAQVAGVAALKDNEYQINSRLFINTEKEWLYNNLQAVNGFKPYQSSVNYILININELGIVSSQLKAKMLKDNIMIRDCSNYIGIQGQFIRVAVKLRTENELLINSFKKYRGVKNDKNIFNSS